MKRPARVRCSAFFVLVSPPSLPPVPYKCSPLFRNITSSAPLAQAVFRLLISIQCDDIVCIILRERIATLLSVCLSVRPSVCSLGLILSLWWSVAIPSRYSDAGHAVENESPMYPILLPANYHYSVYLYISNWQHRNWILCSLETVFDVGPY